MKLQLEVERHEEMRATTVTASLESLRTANDASFDVILSEVACDAASIAHMSRILNDDGLLVTTHPSLEYVAQNKIIMEIMGKYFKIIMPYHLEDGTTLLLASKAYHPTADVILQRADMLDGLSYYNCDIHPAAFAMGSKGIFFIEELPEFEGYAIDKNGIATMTTGFNSYTKNYA